MADHVVAASNFLIPNATFFVEFIFFLIVLAIVARFIMPRVQGPLRERKKMVARQLEDSEEARQRLVAAERSFQQALSEARAEAARIREDARAEAQRTVDDLRDRAREESARIVERGEEQLAAQRTAIVRQLRDEIGTLAVELSEKIVDQRLGDEPEVTSTVDSFLAGLAAEDHARSEVDA